MSSELFVEYGDRIKEQYGYEPSDLEWFLASEIANQYMRMAVAKKLGKDTEVMKRMIESKFSLICRNVENSFITERTAKYGTGN